MAGFSLKDHLFNAESLRDFADEMSTGIPGFDADAYHATTLAGFAERELLQRLDWMADCLEPYLPADFNEMAAQLEAALPPPLDLQHTDNDFGRFIHAVPGILAVRHGLENHHDRALDLLYAATKRFSMEFYIRPFLNTRPQETLRRLAVWARDENYHVRRLVSEGTRPKLPWAKAVTIDPEAALPLLDILHADGTRYVTRSVSNHLNDIAKTNPDMAIDMLEKWAGDGHQNDAELGWMTRHALRGLIRQGNARALGVLGFDPQAQVDVALHLENGSVSVGDALTFDVTVAARQKTPVLIDYVIRFLKSSGQHAPKVFKLKQVVLQPDAPLTLYKTHRFKGDATTFRLYPGTQFLGVQVNGVLVKEAPFTLLPPK